MNPHTLVIPELQQLQFTRAVEVASSSEYSRIELI
jgi:hypothetical protein